MTRNRSLPKAQDNATARPSGLQRRKPSPLALEARLMFDGAAVATAVADAAPVADAHEAVVDKTAAAAQTEASREGAQAVEGATREVAFIDTGVADWQTLAQGIKPGVEVVLLDPAKDGLIQIADYLQGQSGLDTIHIVSHGTSGALLLGGKSYTTEVMEQYQAQFAAIGQALTESGDVLLYGCSIAQGTAGEAFINAVALATSADVEASVDATGAAALGGDWTLEAKVGGIETGLYADLDVLGQYAGVLDQDIPVSFPENSADPVAGGLGSQTNLTGPDKDFFVVSGNKLYFKNPPDFEDPAHSNVYHVSVGNSGNLRNYTITVTDVLDTSVNAAPVANNDSYSTAEDTTLTVAATGVLSNDTDADGNPLTAILVSGPSNGTLTLNANGSFTYTPDANYNGTDSFTYKTRDGSADSNTATVSITINPVNDAPEATADSYSVNEDGSLVVAAAAGVLANDNDANDNPANALTATLVGNVAHGTLNFNPDGSFTYTPNPNFNGQDSFTYQVSDNGGGDSTGNTVAVTINVAPVNDAPVLGGAGGTQIFTEGDGEIVIDSDLSLSDIDDVHMESAKIAIIGYVAGEDELVFANTSNITGAWNGATGVLTLSGTATKAEYEAALESVRYKNHNVDNPTPGSFVVAWSVNDGSKDSAKVYSTVMVRADNDAPVLTGVPATLAGGTEDTTYTITKSDLLQGYTDPEGDALSVTNLSATNGLLTDNGNGTWTFSPNTNYNGPVNLSYNVVDGQGGSVAATQSFTLAPVNDAPAALDDVAAVAESGVSPGNTAFAGTAAATGNVLSNDSDVDAGTTLKVSVVNSVNVAAAGTTVIPGTYGSLTVDANGNYTYALDNTRPATQALQQGQSVSEVFNYTIKDNDGAIASSKLTVTVTGTNDAPDIGFSTTTTLTVENDIQILDARPANPWPATLDVNGATGLIDKVTVTLTLSHTWPNDLDILLVGPEGQGVILMSDAGGSADVSSVVLTFDDAAAQVVSGSGLSTGTYRPANYNDYLGGDAFPGAPGGSYGTSLEVFKGHSPNGSWSLYVMDDAGGDIGVISNWALTFTTVSHKGAVTESGNLDDGTVVPGTPTASGTLTSVDVDTNAQANWSIAGASDYGTMTIDAASGQWTYTLDNGLPATQALREGQVVTETFTATVTDEHDATATQVITITVTGTNDAPVVTSQIAAATGTVTESGSLDDGTLTLGQATATGTLTATDVDASLPLAWSISGTGAYGDIAIDPDTGTWIYTLRNASDDVQALREGDTRTETFTASVTDEKGATATQVITISIAGSNDAPVITSGAADARGTVVESGNLDDGTVVLGTASATGILTSRDVDASATAEWTVSGTGIYGDIAIDPATGRWTYTLDNERATTQDLHDGTVRTETFTATVTDDKGARATQTITVRVRGTNDAPVAQPDVGSVDEDASVTVPTLDGVIRGAGRDTDPDHATRNLQVAGVVAGDAAPADANVGTWVTGTYGMLMLNADGSYQYVANLADSVAQGETVVDTFSYVVRDPAGAVSNVATLAITITGTNDAPYIVEADNSGQVIEDAAPLVLSDSGTITFDDLDLSDSHSVAAREILVSEILTPWGGTLSARVTDPASNSGSGTIEWTYTLDNANVQFLGAGQSASEVFRVTIRDGNGGSASQIVTVTIHGTNDEPYITAASVSGAVTEDASDPVLRDTGTITFDDVDFTDSHTVTVLKDSGALGGSLAAEVIDGALFGSGTVRWTYELPNANAQSLAAGETAAETFTVTIHDGQGGSVSRQVSVTTTGVNDAPEVDAISASFSEDQGGQMTPSYRDADSTDSHVLTIDTSATRGIVSYDNGVFTYDPNGQFEGLAAGQTATDSFTYTVNDGHGGIVTNTATITVTGANDAPVAQDAENDALEAGGVDNGTAGRDAEGRLVFSDIDTGDTVTVVSVSPAGEGSPGTVGMPVRGLYGWVTLQEDGSYIYRVDNDDARVQALRAADQPLMDSFEYEVQDTQGASHTATLRIAVFGQNDNPDGQDDAVTIDEDSSAVINVLANDTDVDQGALLGIKSVEIPRSMFGVSSNPDVGDDRLPSVEIQGRHDSASDVDWFVFTVQDGEQLILDVDYAYRPGQADIFDPMLWVYDAAGNQITGNDDGGLDRPEGQGTVHGFDSFLKTDPLPAGTYRVALTGFYQNPMDPAGQSYYQGGSYVLNVSIVPTSSSSGFGSVPAKLNVAEAGTVTYDPGSAFQYLAAGQTATTSFSYEVADEFGATDTRTVTVTVNGTNDGPVALAAQASVAEDALISGAVSATDADAGETESLTYALVGAAPAGLTFNPDGTYTFDASSYDALANGESLVLTLPFTATDVNNAVSAANLVITVTGTNDGPVAVADAATGGENETLTIDVLANDTDADAGHSFTLVSVSAPTGQGTVSVVDGKLVFNPGGDFDHLAAGTAEEVQLSYLMRDDQGAESTGSVTVTVTGTNDGPVAVADKATGGENETLTLDVLANDTDADTGHSLTLMSSSTLAGKGTVQIENNRLVFNPGSDFDHLAAGATEEVQLSYLMRDDQGAESTGSVTVTVTGTNDGPVALAAQASVAEDASISGAVSATDADAGETESLTYALVGAAPAGLTFNPDGTYTFDASSYDALADGESLVLTIPFTATDVNNAVSAANLVITVTGTNDGPVAVADTATAVEAGAGDAGSNPAGDVLANDTDIDTSDTRTVTAVSFGDQVGEVGQGLQGAYGALTLNADGSYTYLVDNGNVAVQALRTSADTLTETFTYTITDTVGATSSATLTVTIEGRNDAPEATAGIADQALVAGDQYTFELPADLFRDVDAGDTLTYTATLANGDPLPLWLTFDPETRSFTGVANNSDVGVLNIVITVRDASGAAAQVGFALNVAGLATIAPDSTGTTDNGITGIYATTGFNGLNPGRTSGNLGDANAPDPSQISFGPAPAFDPNVLVESNPTAAGLLDQNGDEPVLPIELAMVNLDGNSDFMLFAPSGVKFSFELPSFLVEGPSKADFTAYQMNGEPLPDWLYFDPVTGKFIGKAPKDTVATLRIQLTGKDAKGNERSIRITLTVDPAIERPQLGEAPKIAAGEAPEKAENDAPRGRPGISEQIRLAAKRGTQAERLAKAAAAMKAPAV